MQVVFFCLFQGGWKIPWWGGGGLPYEKVGMLVRTFELTPNGDHPWRGLNFI